MERLALTVKVFPSGGATTLIFIAAGAAAVSTFVMRAKTSGNMFLFVDVDVAYRFAEERGDVESTGRTVSTLSWSFPGQSPQSMKRSFSVTSRAISLSAGSAREYPVGGHCARLFSSCVPNRTEQSELPCSWR